jgi:hypothetical protein
MKQVAKYAPSLSVTVSSVCEKLAAEELFRGKIGAIYQGRSEFGPRALGNRSIVALPSNLARKFQLNSIKNREAFMPFAPAVLEEKLEKYFEASGEFSFMTTAVMTKEIMHSAAPAAIHVDGTARVQAVSKTLAPRFHALLCAVEDLSGHSLLLNTSFNAGGQPIVESLDDALETFEKLDLGFLWAGDCIIKWKSPNKSKDVWRTFIPVLTVNSVVLRHVNVNSLSKLLLENGVNASICERDLFLLYSEYVGWLKNGRKSTTIRYRKNEVDMPAGATLPLYSSSSVLPDAEVEYFGVVFIQSVAVAQFGDLTNEDAIRDGFKDLSELHKALGRIYGIIEYDELVTIYGIALVPVAA